MNAYLELKNRHEKETNEFPLHFAFGHEQIEAKIKELNLDPENWREQVVGIGFGGFVLRDDFPALKEMSARHKREREEAIAGDKTGDGYIYDMFLYELRNHEYSYTLDDRDTIECLDLTKEDIEKDCRLKRGLEKAKKTIRGAEGFAW